ncbi:hypothetical protein SARC_00930 [Sphaeroforma arctica JP610]|uniref:Uncharacterized protein n=1 Tax=Sphaeroforma arctica JP610 TaxID=667725 RepID=A0A0L0GF47_9EUKA|nr:hypothetical protein SARC_00930 [Sphaeroforma arctica JP610]KNC86928.1 hypothetical protein SARC_00930 [Sphaeroforma arctica JP610]|eukprot:XP_014160830.1 hypothetical protein SARC_00930 [Sphaeroforma arctica JP610]
MTKRNKKPKDDGDDGDDQRGGNASNGLREDIASRFANDNGKALSIQDRYGATHVKDIDRKDLKDPIDKSNLALLSRSLKEFGQIMLTANLRQNRWFEAAQQSFKPSSYKYSNLEKAKAAVTKLKT